MDTETLKILVEEISHKINIYHARKESNLDLEKLKGNSVDKVEVDCCYARQLNLPLDSQNISRPFDVFVFYVHCRCGFLQETRKKQLSTSVTHVAILRLQL